MEQYIPDTDIARQVRVDTGPLSDDDRAIHHHHDHLDCLVGHARGHHIPVSPFPLVAHCLPNLPHSSGEGVRSSRYTQRLCDPDVRLVTLTGPGGVGKTRLAYAVAAECAGQFGDGVRWVSLASVDDPDRVLPAMSEQLGIREATDRSISEQIVTALRHQHLLLLVDTFEHLLLGRPGADRSVARVFSSDVAGHQPGRAASVRRT